MWFGILLLFALAVFIVWDSHRLRSAKSEPMAREAMSRGFLPKGLIDWHFYLGFGGISALLAFLEWEQPSRPPFTGRWSWLHQVLFETLGARGLFAWWALLAGVLLVYGIFLSRRGRA